ncbi:MAG: uroporphyrinogen-III synthase [Methylophaga sp.]|nr:MAG: uroporphyrinogen-III synthase [Methylophaga sp.]
MVTKGLLHGLKVLVTRPEQQAKGLCEMIAEAGGEPIAFPVIDIQPITTQHWAYVALAEQDMIIFVSRNAVNNFIAGLDETWPDNVLIVSMGNATTTCLQGHNLSVDIQAPVPAGSESLLAVPALNNVKDKQILIVRGEGGRELLADTLTTRGAKISYIEVYRRCLPKPEAQAVEQAKHVDGVVVTSIVGLDNLCQLINVDSLKNKWLIVVSDRIKQYAMQLGFQRVIVTEDADDIAVMQQVNKWEKFDGKK